MDPNYNIAAYQNVYDVNGNRLNGGALSNAYNPNGYLIVPTGYNINNASQFAATVQAAEATPGLSVSAGLNPSIGLGANGSSAVIVTLR